ncbi:MAG TPA: PRC-barrel domain-containing protein [Verrucomicrobiae bacterium]|nr:PRC-barrel domain-containing protein [Verrucomicrobiae bacterium]
MLAASAWAQTESTAQPSNDSNRSWSTKHLSATGRNNDHSVRGSQLTGAPVNNSSGQRMAMIQDVIINPASGRIDFALLSLNPSTSEHTPGKLVPVPWSLLKTAAASSQYASSSEQPTFILNVDQKKLNSAPTVEPSEWGQSEWQQRVYSYYGVTPGAVGGAESPSGEIKGEGARRMQNSTPNQ